jgi:hypothetical protein
MECGGLQSSHRRCSILEADGNCVAAMRGGEQPEANLQSAGDKRDSAGCSGEPAREWRNPDTAQTGRAEAKPGVVKSVALGEQVKSDDGAHQVVGGGMRRRSRGVNRGDLTARRRSQESEGP